MKYLYIAVAPYTGAWIEIPFAVLFAPILIVAPYTGAWIEILFVNYIIAYSREVAPYTGAWIEIRN